jgi:hypothetical protein
MVARRSTSTVLLSILVLLVCALLPRAARADRSALVHVIALDSDDASEDQADALSSALRARVRNTPGWQTAESNMSLSTLLPALKCPTRPDAACLQRIGDQLKTDRFFWGSVMKAPIAHQVVAEVHLWVRGKPEQVAKETYSDNLKDQNDESLRRIAAQIFERLTGMTAQGTLIVKAPGADKGTVMVDGTIAGQLDHGMSTLLVSAGAHQVDVQVEGMSSTPQSVTVTPGTQAEVSIALKSGGAIGPVTGPSKPFPIKKVVGFSAMGLGIAAGVVSVVLAASYASGMSDWDKFRTGLSDPTNPSQPAQQLCTPGSPASTYYNSVDAGSLTAACNKAQSATTNGTVAWILGGVGVGLIVVGAVLVFTDHPKEDSAPTARLRVLPTFGPNSAGIDALVTF